MKVFTALPVFWSIRQSLVCGSRLVFSDAQIVPLFFLGHKTQIPQKISREQPI